MPPFHHQGPVDPAHHWESKHRRRQIMGGGGGAPVLLNGLMMAVDGITEGITHGVSTRDELQHSWLLVDCPSDSWPVFVPLTPSWRPRRRALE